MKRPAARFGALLWLALGTCLLAAPVAAGDAVTCPQWARMVQQLDTMPPETRAKWRDELARAAREDDRVRAALKALNYIEAGGRVSDAWRQCPST